MMTLGRQIKVERTKLGLTQVELAERAGMNPTTLSQIELDNAEPRLATLRQIASALGIPLETLIPADPPAPPSAPAQGDTAAADSIHSTTPVSPSAGGVTASRPRKPAATGSAK